MLRCSKWRPLRLDGGVNVTVGLQEYGNCHESLPFSLEVGRWTADRQVAGANHGFSVISYTLNS